MTRLSIPDNFLVIYFTYVVKLAPENSFILQGDKTLLPIFSKQSIYADNEEQFQ